MGMIDTVWAHVLPIVALPVALFLVKQFVEQVPDSLIEAANFVQIISKRQNYVISAPEEIAYKYKWISKKKLLESAERYGKSPYGEHLKAVAEGTTD